MAIVDFTRRARAGDYSKITAFEGFVAVPRQSGACAAGAVFETAEGERVLATTRMVRRWEKLAVSHENAGVTQALRGPLMRLNLIAHTLRRESIAQRYDAAIPGQR